MPGGVWHVQILSCLVGECYSYQFSIVLIVSLERLDPIVSPGVNPSQHVHVSEISGNSVNTALIIPSSRRPFMAAAVSVGTKPTGGTHAD